MNPSDLIEAAFELGVDAAGLAPLEPPPEAARFESWLAKGHQAGMDWLLRDRERILDPRSLLPEKGVILAVAVCHARNPVELSGGGRIARYAAGRDYHNWLGKRLRRLARTTMHRTRGRARAIVDAGPLMERSHGRAAGLGFHSKAANLLSRPFGPWFFLGELLLVWPDGDPEFGRARSRDDSQLDLSLGSCGTCRRCIDACPTQAIVAPGEVDAGRCISYHTIENREAPAVELRALFSDWVFGCDICSEVCPWGSHAKDQSERFGTHPAVEGGQLIAWVSAWRREAEAKAALVGSPLSRPGVIGLARNAAIALGNHPQEQGRDRLIEALEAPAAMLREVAAWALAEGHAGEQGVRGALEAARARETELLVRQRIEMHLERATGPGG